MEAGACHFVFLRSDKDSLKLRKTVRGIRQGRNPDLSRDPVGARYPAHLHFFSFHLILRSAAADEKERTRLSGS